MSPSALRRTGLTFATASLLLQAGIAQAATPVAVGTQIAVSGAQAHAQIDAAIATHPDGSFVAVWQSQTGPENSIRSILARRYNARGEALDRLPIELYSGDYHSGFDGVLRARPAVAVSATGDFVVTWTRPNGNQPGWEVYAQRLSAAGAKLGSAFGVSFGGPSNYAPAVAIDAQGRFMIVWQHSPTGRGQEIHAALFNADGTRSGSGMSLGDDNYIQESPSVSTNPRGEFVVAWKVNSGTHLAMQRFNSNGSLRGARLEILGSSHHIETVRGPAVAVNPSGAFVVAWESKQDRSDYDIVARGVNADGSWAGPQFNVSGFEPGDQTGAALSMDVNGGFVVAWDRGSGSPGIAAQRFNANGGLDGSSFTVSAGSGGDGRKPALGLDADGDFVVAWHGLNVNSGNDIHARRYQGARAVNLSLVQSDSKDPAPTNGALSYTINVSNLEAAESPTQYATVNRAMGAATGLVVEDILPSGVTNVSASGRNWSCTLPTGKVVCQYSQVLRAGSFASPLEVRLTTPNSDGVTLHNDARVKGNQLDGNTLNNREVESTRLVTGS